MIPARAMNPIIEGAVTGAVNRTWQVPTWQDDAFNRTELAAYVEELRRTIRSAAVAPWTPERWIVSDPIEPSCTVVSTPHEPLDHYEAPVYPHAANDFPLGSFEC